MAIEVIDGIYLHAGGLVSYTVFLIAIAWLAERPESSEKQINDKLDKILELLHNRE